MRKIFSLALSLLAVQSTIIASQGGFTASFAPAASSQRGKPGPLAYAIAFNPVDPTGEAQFGFLDIGTGIFLTVANLPNGAQGIARDNGQIFAVDAANNLVRIDPGNGKTTVVGPTGITTPGPVGGTLVDVIAALETGDLFLMDYSNNLYSVDRKTGAATLIGSTGIPAIISPFYSSSLAGDCTSLFFTINEVDENRNLIIPPTLYRIDPHTGTATLIGPTAPVMPGSGFINGTLYGFSLDRRLFGGTEPPHVFSIDTSTGAATRVSDLNVPGIGGAVGLPSPQGCKAK